MRRKTVLKILGLVALGVVATSGRASDKSARTTQSVVGARGMQTNLFLVEGMHCNGCAGGLRSELKAARGVANADVVLSNKTATVIYDAAKTNPEKLIHVIQESGFKGALKP